MYEIFKQVNINSCGEYIDLVNKCFAFKGVPLKLDDDSQETSILNISNYEENIAPTLNNAATDSDDLEMDELVKYKKVLMRKGIWLRIRLRDNIHCFTSL